MMELMIQNTASAKPQDALLYDMELPLRDTFYPLGFGVEILTNDCTVLEAAHHSFGHIREVRSTTPIQIRIGISEGGGRACLKEPTRREFNHLYSLVSDADNQALLDLKTGTSFAWLQSSSLGNMIYFRNNFLEKMVYLQLGASVVTDLHAACVSKGGKGILLCGSSGAGKSTLAYACARAGWTYTSDDTSYLINDDMPPRVTGHSHRVRFRPAAKALFPELERFAITARIEGKPSVEVSISDLPVFNSSCDARVHAIVYLTRGPLEEGCLVQLPARTATKRMSKELFSAGDLRRKHEEILEVFADVPTYELRYVDSGEAIVQLSHLAHGL